MKTNTSIGTAAYALAVLCMAIMDACSKLLGENYSVFQIILFRSLFAFPPVIAIGMWDHKMNSTPMVLSKKYLSLHILRGILFALTWATFILSLKWLPLADATGITLAAPIFMVIFGVLILKENIRWSNWAAILLGLIGVGLILEPSLNGPLFAKTLALMSAILFALVAILTKKMALMDSTFSIVFWSNTILFLLGIFGCAILRLNIPGSKDILVFLIMGFAGGFGNILFVVALRISNVSSLAVFEYSIFIWAVLFGFLIFGNTPSIQVWAGVLTIAACGIYMSTRQETGPK